MGVPSFKAGYLKGTGAAINVECGFIPDYVKIINCTDGDLITEGMPSKRIIPYTSGGTTEITAGMTIRGATSVAVRIRIESVLLYSGTWAGGDAAGVFIADEADCVGNVGSENIVIVGTTGTNDATVTAGVNQNVATAAAVAGATGNAAISAYAGSRGTLSKGFTIGSTVSEDDKLLYWMAFRNVL